MSDKTLIQSFLEYLTAEKGYSPLTIRTYESVLRGFEQYFQHLDAGLTWETIDRDVIRGWIVELGEDGTDNRTVKKNLSSLSSFYRYLLRMNIVGADPTHLVPRPKTHKKLPQFLRANEMNRLLDDISFEDNFEGCRDRLILLLFYSTGIRVSECEGLNLSNISLTSGELKVLGKRNKERIIPFGAELQHEIADYLKLRRDQLRVSSDALFTDAEGNRLTSGKLREIVKFHLSKVSTLQKRTPHVLRHTFATVMINNGADIRAVQELLGHESLSTTEIYTHVTFKELRDEYEKAHPREQ